WLVLPFFLSFAYRGRMRVAHMVALSSALLLTGSLTGIVAVAGGIGGGWILGNPLSRRRLRMPLTLAAAAGLGLLVFNAVAVSNGTNTAGLWEVVSGRMEDVLSGGLSASNRSYVYEYTSEQPMPLVGSGLGHAQLLFTASDNTAVISSFLNLYLNYLFALGVPGVVLLALLLAPPAVRLARQPRYRNDPELMLLMAAYLGWLLMFAVHSEELSLVFGIVFGMVAFEGRRAARVPPTPAEPAAA
ncbi:MAG TPA: hypothetical protein VEQ60_17540, partial [Longimicrobium sp.]|nr:hypothetical protein [Longimicrobium sp.]